MKLRRIAGSNTGNKEQNTELKHARIIWESKLATLWLMTKDTKDRFIQIQYMTPRQWLPQCMTRPVQSKICAPVFQVDPKLQN